MDKSEHPKNNKNESTGKPEVLSQFSHGEVTTANQYMQRCIKTGTEALMGLFGTPEIVGGPGKESPSTAAPWKKAEPVTSIKDFVSSVKNLFHKIDKDKVDRYLSDKELGTAIENPEFNGTHAEMISTLYKHRESLKLLSNDEWGSESEVSLNDIRALSNLRPKPDSTEAQLAEQINQYLAEAHKLRLDSQSSTLYQDNSKPLENIRPESILQGQIGDCYLLATIGALATSNPQRMHDMIKDNRNNTFTVTFPGEPNNPITVQAPTEAERILYNHGGASGLWPNVLEKAFGEYRRQHGYKGNNSTEGADGGGSPKDVLQLFTGKDPHIDRLDSPETTIRNLTEAFNDKRAVVGSSTRTLPETARLLTERHAYTILGWGGDWQGWRRENDQFQREYLLSNGYLRLRDPKGFQYQARFDQIRKELSQFTFEGR